MAKGGPVPVSRPARVLLLGIDAAVPGRWRRFAAEGLLPVGRRLLAEGRFARCLPAMPTLTTTNWATIATGARPGTHGITDFNPHRVGDLPGASLQGFDARDVRAEFIWETVARAGGRSAVVNWPGSWPPREATPAGVTIVGGAGVELNEWRVGMPERGQLVALAAEQRFSTIDERGAARVTLPPAGEVFELPFAYRAARDPVRPGLALACRLGERRGRPTARFTLPESSEALAELAAGEWSERLVLPFEVDGQTVPGAFRLKVLALEPAAGLFRLYVTDVCRLTWLERPAGVLGDPARFVGLPTPGVGWDSLAAGLIDLDTFVELTDMATRWLADVCTDLVARQPCDLFCAHFHAVDSFYHLCLAGLDEQRTPDPAERRRYHEVELAVYREVDEAIGRLVEAAGDDVLTVLVSDHGVVPPGRPAPLTAILHEAGLLAVSRGGSGGGPDDEDLGSGSPGGDGVAIDWRQTLAAPQGSCFVRLNLAGREPLGIVERADAGRVRDEVVGALLDYRDPATGLCPFSLVATKEDAAALLGLRGDGVGDVVYAVRPEFSDVHGSMLPDAEVAVGDWGMRAMCLFSGTGAAPGADLPDGTTLADVAPTVCRALGVPRPADSDGVVCTGMLAPGLVETAARVTSD